MCVEKSLIPRLLTTQEACCYLFGEHSRSMASRLYRATRDPNSGLKSIRLLPSAQHYWSVFELDKLTKDPVAEAEAAELEAEANKTSEVFSEKQ